MVPSLIYRLPFLNRIILLLLLGILDNHKGQPSSLQSPQIDQYLPITLTTGLYFIVEHSVLLENKRFNPIRYKWQTRGLASIETRQILSSCILWIYGFTQPQEQGLYMLIYLSHPLTISTLVPSTLANYSSSSSSFASVVVESINHINWRNWNDNERILFGQSSSGI